MARVRQFAKDMGMSYNQANNLVKKGRALKDGGSSVLESTMNQAKPIKANNGKITKLKKTTPKSIMGNFKNIVNQSVSGKISTEEAEKKIKKLMLSKKNGGGNNFGMLSVKAGIDKNPNPTQADRIAGATMKEKVKTAKKGAIIKMRDGGQFRGCGAQVKGKKFKGIF